MNVTNFLFIRLISFVIFLGAITIHEFSHALSAYLLGDDTARRYGRLTLNPIAHIDPLGLLCLVLFRIGWAKPVPMDPRNFAYPRFYSVLSALAGPASNFIMAIFFLFGIKLTAPLYFATPGTHLWLEFFRVSALVNVMLGTFNLLPIPPLDGSHIIQVLIPASWQYRYYYIQRYAMFFLLFLVMIPAVNAALFSTITSVYMMLAKMVLGQ